MTIFPSSLRVQEAVIRGSLALAERGHMTEQEAVVSYRCGGGVPGEAVCEQEYLLQDVADLLEVLP